MIKNHFENILAVRGEEFNKDLSQRQQNLVNTFGCNNYFHAAIADAFVWTGHAIEEKTFFESAINYLFTGNWEYLNEAENFFGRFGPLSLYNGLNAWKICLDSTENLNKKISLCTAQELYTIQENYLYIMSHLMDQRKISGIGPWLFCAPFNIVAVYRTELWNDTNLDRVLML